MPSIIGGPLKILEISGGSVIFGDTAIIAPKNTGKSYSGSGGGLTGDFPMTITGISSTNTADPDVIDNNNTTVI